MKLYNAGDKGRALCENCNMLVDTTFEYRNVPFDDGIGMAKDILAAVCDRCGEVVAIPAQSIPAIKTAREKASEPLEVKLPAPYLEKLDLAAYMIDPQATSEFRKYLFSFYVHKLASMDDIRDEISPFLLIAHSIDAHDRTTPKRRWSCKVTPRLNHEIHTVLDATDLRKTELVKAVICKIDKEIIRKNKPAHINELRRLAAVAAG